MTFPLEFLKLMRIIGLLGLALALQACSAVKLAYNQAPTLAYLYLDDYVDFNEAQSTQVKSELAKFQAWHRQTQLPAYIELLQKMQQQMLKDITASQACDVFSEVRQKALVMSDFAEPAALLLAASFSPKQLASMQNKFTKGNAKWREDYLEGTAKELAEKRHKSAVKRGDMWYGSVSDSQRVLITQQVARSPFKPAQSYAERQRRQKDVLQTLTKAMASPQDMATLQQDLRSLLARSVTSPDLLYRSYLETVTQEGCANFAELHNTTTPEQRKNAVQVLAGYEQDFRKLMAQKVNPG